MLELDDETRANGKDSSSGLQLYRRLDIPRRYNTEHVAAAEYVSIKFYAL